MRRRLGFILLLLSALAAAAAAAEDPFAAWAGQAADTGASEVRLFWSLPPGGFPAGGFRVEAANGRRFRPLAEVTLGEDRAAVAAAGPETAALIEKLRGGAGRAATAEERQLQHRLLLLQAAGDFTLARALGLGWVDRSGRPAARYRVSALAAGGAVTATAEATLDPSAPAAPAGPVQLAAEAETGGVRLRWTAPGQPVPVISHRTLRRRADGDGWETLDTRLVRTDPETGDSGEILDSSPPVSAEVRYAVRLTDLLGRESPPSPEVTVWVPDRAALAPVVLQATPGPRGTELSWPEAATGGSGITREVARALGPHGPFTTLTADGFRGTSFFDATGKPGTTYHYAVRGVDPRGVEGPWSSAVPVRFAGPGLEAPRELQAMIGVGRVRLRWAPGSAAGVAGYQVERATAAGDFLLLDQELRPTPDFDDPFLLGAERVRRYRVRAHGWGDVTSPWSQVVEVTLPDRMPPPAPRLLSADSSVGGVELRWETSGEEGEVAGWFVLRSTSPTSPGAPAHAEPLAAELNSYEDRGAPPGLDVAYRIVAFDAAGNWSRPSEARWARAGRAALAAPPGLEAVSVAEGIELRIGAVEAAQTVVVQRRTGDGPWVRIAGPITARDRAERAALIDRAPRVPAVAYRLVTVGRDGQVGPTGAAVSVSGTPGS